MDIKITPSPVKHIIECAQIASEGCCMALDDNFIGDKSRSPSEGKYGALRGQEVKDQSET